MEIFPEISYFRTFVGPYFRISVLYVYVYVHVHVGLLYVYTYTCRP